MTKLESNVQIDGYEDFITFAVNDGEKLLVFLDCALKNISQFDYMSAVYIKDNVCEQVIYSNDMVFDFIESLHDALTKSLSGEYMVYESSNQDLGYLWNVYLNRSDNMYFSGQFEHWIGRRYLLWSLQGTACWLYKTNGVVYFEITPVYKWHSRDPEPEEEDAFISYEQFIKNYKPYMITEVSRDVVREWLRQTERLLAIIKANDEKYLSDSNTNA